VAARQSQRPSSWPRFARRGHPSAFTVDTDVPIYRRHDADQALVAVQDSGTGIDPDKWTGLFTAFFTTKPDGMGMGLSICRSIIEAHGGEMWASPNDGFGATFSFTVQIEQGAAE
jgi:signal transduction histidine kinase